MKIQCACGARYAFDITPGMTAPVDFVCPACGLNISVPVAKPAIPVAVLIRSAEHAAPAEPAPAETPQPCLKHFGQFLTTNRCVVCQKPLCPQCMALFGWVCSPLCRNKAETHGLEVPEFEGKKSVVERQQWRKTARNAGAIAAAVLLVLGAWCWYEWFGSVPKTFFSAMFPEAASSGELRAGARDQIILLHGGTLYRHDLKTKHMVWAVPLIDRESIARQAGLAYKAMERGREAAVLNGADRDDLRLPSMDEVSEGILNSAMQAMSLQVWGENIWVAAGGTLTRYDWDTGKAGQTIALGESFQSITQRGGECLVLAGEESGTEIRRIDLGTGEMKLETIARLTPATPGRSNAGPALVARAKPGGAVRPGGAQLDPAKIARDIQNLPLPNRLALPATLAAAANQERLKAELNGVDPDASGKFPAGGIAPAGDDMRLIPTAGGYVQFASRLTDRRSVTRKVMKDPPGKSALDGPVNQAATVAIANEILNDIARDRLGDSVEEDESRYQVTLHRPGVADWTEEVIGQAGFIPLDTVEVVTGSKSIIVLDKANKKLWEAKLTYNVSGGDGFDGEQRLWGAGPAVERGETLYLFDGGVLTAFELRTGNARWRLPSVGIAGLFFDGQGMIYVNTTTASHDSVRFSRQIDVSQKTRNVVLKLDPKTGRTLWHADNDGMVRYLSGKFIYTVESSAGEDGGFMNLKFGPAVRPHIRIKRLSASSGRVMWEHHQERAPLDVQFERNEIRILFRKELQVLRFLTW